jgi:transcription antitermination factor NusG
MLDGGHNQDLPARHELRGQPRSAATPCGTYPDPGRCWSVVHTNPNAETWAAANLQRRGFVTFLPETIIHRRDSASHRRIVPARVPLFPRYCFVMLAPDWPAIARTAGVHQLLMVDGKPGIVAKADFQAVQAAMVQAAMVQAAIQPPENAFWPPGTPCSLTTGPFAELDAVVLSVHRNIAQVGIICMGALRSVSVDVACLTTRGD